MKFFLLIILVLLLWSTASATQFDVGAGQKHTTISAALALCADYDTVVVHAGHYKEGNIIIAKSNTFIGLGRPVIDGKRKSEEISIKAPYVNMRGFKVIR